VTIAIAYSIFGVLEMALALTGFEKEKTKEPDSAVVIVNNCYEP
jgi:hypothetical protein